MGLQLNPNLAASQQDLAVLQKPVPGEKRLIESIAAGSTAFPGGKSAEFAALLKDQLSELPSQKTESQPAQDEAAALAALASQTARAAQASEAQAQPGDPLKTAGVSPKDTIQGQRIESALARPTAQVSVPVSGSKLSPAVQAELSKLGLASSAPAGAQTPAQSQVRPQKNPAQGAANGQSAQSLTQALPGAALDASQLQALAGAAAAAGVPSEFSDASAIADEDALEQPSAAPTLKALSGSEFLSARPSAAGMAKTDAAGVDAASPAAAAVKSSQASKKSKDVDPAQLRLSGLGQDKIAQKSQRPTQGIDFAPVDARLAQPAPAKDSASFSAPAPVVVAGNVTQGAATQHRLDRSSLMGLSNAIHVSARGGDSGTVRIRLHPESLGEINVRIHASGNQVGLQVQAADESAKKILESSIADLKEQLSGQNLKLVSVDFTVSQSSGSSDSKSMDSSQSGSSHHSSLNQWSETEQGRKEQREWASRAEQDQALARPVRSTRLPQAPVGSMNRNGRLDVVV